MASNELERIVYLTAGAAGMYCGSCMHDNTLARALLALGVDVQLIPLYTPIRVDEPDVSLDRVFFGGVNVYLQHRFGLFRLLPAWLDRLLDRPALLRWIGSRGMETSAQQLGSLTVSMLRGAQGAQRKEVHRLCHWLAGSPKPDVVILTNVLIAGCVPELKATLGVPVLVTLQGDDLFLEQLPACDKARALAEIHDLAQHIDGFLVHSRYYADFMSDYLGIDRARFHCVPLGVDTSDTDGATYPAGESEDGQSGSRNIAYLARLAPEKGLHVLVDAFLLLKQMPAMDSTRLVIAGWQGKRDQSYVDQQLAKLQNAGLADHCQLLGTIDGQQKRSLLGQAHLLSVPTVYREPKGLYVLEALAAGVPVVQPNHGVFPELLAATGGGRLVPPENPRALAEAWHGLLVNEPERHQLAIAGQTAVHTTLNAQAAASETLRVLRRLLTDSQARPRHRASPGRPTRPDP